MWGLGRADGFNNFLVECQNLLIDQMWGQRRRIVLEERKKFCLNMLSLKGL